MPQDVTGPERQLQTFGLVGELRDRELPDLLQAPIVSVPNQAHWSAGFSQRFEPEKEVILDWDVALTTEILGVENTNLGQVGFKLDVLPAQAPELRVRSESGKKIDRNTSNHFFVTELNCACH